MPSSAVRIAPSLLIALHNHAREQPHQEVCGVLLGAWGATTTLSAAVRGVNLATAHDRFLLDAATLLVADHTAAAHHLAIVGFYHSHPSQYPVPSRLDRRDAWANHVYLIVSTQPTATCAWRVDDMEHAHPLLIVPEHQRATDAPIISPSSQS